MASGYKLGGALLGVALAVTSPAKAQEANVDNLSPDIVATQVNTKNYLAIIGNGEINTYTVYPNMLTGKIPECKIIEGWGETYVLKGNQNIKTLVNDNPRDPIENSRLTYKKVNGETGECNELGSDTCQLSVQDFRNLTNKILNGDNCSNGNFLAFYGS